MKHWGFQHRTVLTWLKEGAFGLGSYFRNSTEHVLFGTLGETTTRAAAESISTHFTAPRGEHSEKPECFYMTAQLPDDSDIAIELKIVRWPGAKRGTPAQYHYKDLFLETYSCTVPNHETRGWLYSSKADILLWCQCAFDERSINCWPFPFQRLQRWHDHHKDRLETRDVENIINGHALWTRGHLASIQKICRDLKVEGFKIDQNGLISDLWGAPLLRFLGEA